ncbi:cob(I)yrinic acid a,c-diamide adenosyltransferase [Marinobacter caseinilyticus]|uniref:cob(I)yrinic acid a,c-diamide adenosyltransferase n=1 Tax=Marinobacter caseinilyticus TaxID=2692195 RepID=UPI00140D5E79|nr:cob(I)yrinic acid a,c-diamide adenosyltransferase [Marinobacter caseinilyticus]
MRDRAKDPERHARRMAAKQKIMQERIAHAQKEQGILLVLTGPGKGKSSSGFGMVARALGHGMKVGIVQFIKGAFSTGEEAFFRDLPNVDYHVMGQGYTWDTQDREQDVTAAEAAWDIASRMLSDDRYDLILLDELNIALHYDYLSLDRVLDDLQGRPERQHVAVTGRHAPKELIELADTVTDMQVVKHAFKDQGIKAQKGVEL